MESKVCCHCGDVLESQKGDRLRSLERRLRNSVDTCASACQVIFGRSVPRRIQNKLNVTYVCATCHTVLGQMYRAHKRWNELAGHKSIFKFKKKNKETLETDERKKTVTTLTKPKRKKTPLQQTVVKYITTGKYGQVLTTLYKRGGVQQCVSIRGSLQYLIRREVDTAKLSIGSDMTNPLQEAFHWKKFLKKARQCCPLLYCCITAALTTQSSEKEMKTAKGYSLRPIQGGVLSTILHQNHPRKVKSFQTFNGLQLYMSGAKRETIASFNKLGLCISYSAVSNILDDVIKSFDEEIKMWRSKWEGANGNLENEAQFTEDTNVQPAPTDDLLMAVARSNLSDVLMDDCEPNISCTEVAVTSTMDGMDDTEDCMMYTVYFNNVNINVKTRSETLSKQNQQVSMVQSYAIQDRIPLPRTAANEDMPSADDILSIPLSSYLPTPQDIEEDFNERKRIVGRVLAKWIHCFGGKKKEMALPINHHHSAQSALRSKMIPLGVKVKDECRVGDVIDYLSQLHNHVPHVSSPTEEPTKVLIFADDLNCEHIEDAKRAKMSDVIIFERLEQFEAAISDWHKCVLLLQDAYDELLVEESAKSLGTMCGMRNVMKQRNAKVSVKKSFDSSFTFMEMLTESYIIAAALDYLNMENMDDDLGEDDTERVAAIFESVCDHVTRLGTEFPTSISVDMSETSSPDKDEYGFCLCKDDVGGAMVECGNGDCPSGKWFHLQCVHATEKDIRKGKRKWFCSADCQPNKKRAGKSSTKEQEATRDSIYEYTRAILWHGITTLARQDAIRENDGPRIIRHWKYDIIQFARLRHYKYFKLALNLLTSVEGGSSKRLAHQLTWCRTVNPSGQPGQNVAVDLQMEHFNQVLKASADNLTEKTIVRSGRLVGTEQQLEEEYDRCVTESKSSSRCNKDPSLEEMTKAVGRLRSSSLFTVHPGRAHSGLTNFKFTPFEIDIDKLRGQLQRGQKDIANMRKMEIGIKMSSLRSTSE